METIPKPEPPPPAAPERLAYSVQEAADLLGVDYFSVYRLIQRGRLKVHRALRGKFTNGRRSLTATSRITVTEWGHEGF